MKARSSILRRDRATDNQTVHTWWTLAPSWIVINISVCIRQHRNKNDNID